MSKYIFFAMICINRSPGSHARDHVHYKYLQLLWKNLERVTGAEPATLSLEGSKTLKRKVRISRAYLTITGSCLFLGLRRFSVIYG